MGVWEPRMNNLNHTVNHMNGKQSSCHLKIAQGALSTVIAANWPWVQSLPSEIIQCIVMRLG